jgi:hypothetical protein
MSVLTTVHRLRAHAERAEEDLRCPTDDWAFPPRYTGGRCPICGWVPEGWSWSPPQEHEFGAWMVRLVLLAVAVSAVVLWLTLSIYQRN